MSVKRFLIGLCVFVALFFVCFFFIKIRFSWPVVLIYSIFALVFSFVISKWIGDDEKKYENGNIFNDGNIPFNKISYLLFSSVFIVWSLILLVVMGTNSPPAWMTVIPAGVLFLIFYVIGYKKKKFNSYIKISFVVNYIYLFITSLSTWMLSASTNSSAMGAGYVWIFVILPATYLCILISFIFLGIGLTRSR